MMGAGGRVAASKSRLPAQPVWDTLYKHFYDELLHTDNIIYLLHLYSSQCIFLCAPPVSVPIFSPKDKI